MYDLGSGAYKNGVNNNRTYFRAVLKNMYSASWGEFAYMGVMQQCDRITNTLNRNMFKNSYMTRAGNDAAYNAFTNIGDIWNCANTPCTRNTNIALPSKADWDTLINAKSSTLNRQTSRYGAFSSYFSRISMFG